MNPHDIPSDKLIILSEELLITLTHIVAADQQDDDSIYSGEELESIMKALLRGKGQ